LFDIALEYEEETSSGTSVLATVVGRVRQITNEHLMDQLLTKNTFIAHVQAINKYLLLGQGDFIQQLLSLIRFVCVAV
jgi:hypothetical protein